MYHFLLPLLAGFFCAGASAFTAAWSRRWGDRGGRLATNLLRNMLGIPLYFLGLVQAWRTTETLLFDPGAVGLGLGWLLVAAGAIPVLLGHWQLGWRTHMPAVGDALMEGGMYAHVRHPIYAGGLLIFAGLLLLRPSAPWLLACALGLAFFGVQSRLEEIDLLQRVPGYREYMMRVPRFVPRGLQRWAWLCPALGLVMAAAVFHLWGLSWWTAILAALMLACPLTLLWWWLFMRRYGRLGKGAEFSCGRDVDKKGEQDER